MRLLVIDDDRDYCELLGRKLAGRFDIAFCHSIGDGTHAMKQRQPDVVLLDLSLPDSDKEPIQTLSRVKESRTTAAIVILTGNSDPQVAKSLINGTASGVLVKDRDDRDPELMNREILEAITSFGFTGPMTTLVQQLKGT